MEKIIVVDGAVSLTVESGSLVIRKGVPRGNQTHTIEMHDGVKTIVIPSEIGEVSLGAMRWMSDAGITWCALHKGRMMGYGTHEAGTDAKLVRAQADSKHTPLGLQITRTLLGAKFRGQLDVLAELEPDQVAECERIAATLATAKDYEAARGIEAEIARRYWQAWLGVRMEFETPVPPHWETYPGRNSPKSGNSARNAVEPLNAVLNYAHGVLEVLTLQAVQTLDMSPLLGWVHTDQPNKHPAIFDFMEAAYPLVEREILAWVRSRTFRKGADFVAERDTGIVRITSRNTGHIARLVADVVADAYPVWESVRELLEQAQTGSVRTKRPLTGARRRARFAAPAAH